MPGFLGGIGERAEGDVGPSPSSNELPDAVREVTISPKSSPGNSITTIDAAHHDRNL